MDAASDPTPTDGPTKIVLPNTVDEKMEAIVNCSKALVELSKAINSVNVQVSISHCIFAAPNDGPTLEINT
jgi:hypothetical protein